VAEISVPLEAAQAGRFPPVCAMTGTPAAGAIPMRLERSFTRWRSPKVRIPLSTPAFKAWSRRQSVMVKARMAAIALVVVALGFSARNAFLALTALVLSGVVMAISLRAERSLADHEPGLSRSKGDLLLTGVHPNFVRAVESGSMSP